MEFALLRGLREHDARPDPAVICYGNVVRDRRVDPQKAIISYIAEARHHDVRRDKYVIPNSAVMPDVVPAP